MKTIRFGGGAHSWTYRSALVCFRRDTSRYRKGRVRLRLMLMLRLMKRSRFVGGEAVLISACELAADSRRCAVESICCLVSWHSLLSCAWEACERLSSWCMLMHGRPKIADLAFEERMEGKQQTSQATLLAACGGRLSRRDAFTESLP